MKGAFNIIFIIACYFTVNGIYVPAMPDIATYFHSSGETIRVSMTLFQLGALISCIVAGFFADSIGKKNFLLIGLFTALMGSFICLITPNVTVLFLGRFLQGLGAATGFMMGFALAVDLYKPTDTLRIIALNGIVVSAISVLIPALGGFVTSMWDWHATFWVIIPFFALALINSIISIPKEANIQRESFNLRQGVTEYIKILTNIRYLCYAILNSLSLGSITFSLSYLPFFYKGILQLPANQIGLLIGAAIFMPFGLSSLSSIRLYNKLGIDKSITIGLTVCISGAILLVLTALISQEALLPNVFGVILFFTGCGIFYSGSISESLSIFLDLTTKASSLRTIMISLFSLFGGLMAQYVSEVRLIHYAFVMMIFAILSVLFFRLRNKRL